MIDYEQAAIKAIELAGKHIKPSTRTSAGTCLMDAIACRGKGRYEGAYNRALDSLRHSVGVFHRDYVRAREQEDS